MNLTKEELQLVIEMFEARLDDYTEELHKDDDWAIYPRAAEVYALYVTLNSEYVKRSHD